MAQEKELASNLLDQVFALWINPEVSRRKESGSLEQKFALSAAQVVIHVDSPIEVRLNNEIKGLLKAKASRPIAKGEAIRNPDFSEILDFELVTPDDNAGHVTVILHRGLWFIKFDFLYNKSRIREALVVAREFIESAKASLDRKHMHAFSEALFGATELLAKAMLLKMPDEKILKAKTHSFVGSGLNRQAKVRDSIREYAKLLNQLTRLRSSARYLNAPLSLDPGSATQMLSTAESMYEELSSELPDRLLDADAVTQETARKM
jgi:uncharacterized protein (UPF0332 family)